MPAIERRGERLGLEACLDPRGLDECRAENDDIPPFTVARPTIE